MLVQPDRKQLGDSRLDPSENLAKLKEGNASLDERKKMAGQAELEDSDRIGGSRMSINELLRKLWKLNLNIKVMDGAPGNIAIYVLKTRKELEESINERDFSRPAWWNDFKYVTGCLKEPLPEYSGVTLDERGIAKREIRSWRSVLIALIKNRAITYRQANEEFGPALGSRSWRFEEQLQNYK